jgi:hypothetical protein
LAQVRGLAQVQGLAQVLVQVRGLAQVLVQVRGLAQVLAQVRGLAQVQEVGVLGQEHLHILWKMHIVSPPGHHPNCGLYQMYRLDISILFLQTVLENMRILSF